VEKVCRRRKRRPATPETPCVFEITLSEKRSGWLFLRDVFAAGCGDERFGKPLAFSESPSEEKGQDGFFCVMSSPPDAAMSDSENPWRFLNHPQRKKARMAFSA
jgi:hypothetical protein